MRVPFNVLSISRQIRDKIFIFDPGKLYRLYDLIRYFIFQFMRKKKIIDPAWRFYKISCLAHGSSPAL